MKKAHEHSDSKIVSHKDDNSNNDTENDKTEEDNYDWKKDKYHNEKSQKHTDSIENDIESRYCTDDESMSHKEDDNNDSPKNKRQKTTNMLFCQKWLIPKKTFHRWYWD